MYKSSKTKGLPRASDADKVSIEVAEVGEDVRGGKAANGNFKFTILLYTRKGK